MDAFRAACAKKYRGKGKTVPYTKGLPDLSKVPKEVVVPGIGESIRGIEVHGGLTYANGCQEDSPEDLGICHKPEASDPDEVWWFGFDCAHAWDIMPAMMATRREHGIADWAEEKYRDLAYVTAECESLAKQLLKMEEAHNG